MLMVYQYKRKTRRPILSAVSELLPNKMQDYTALFWCGRFLLQRVQPFFKRAAEEVSPPLLYPMYMYVYMVPKPLIIYIIDMLRWTNT